MFYNLFIQRSNLEIFHLILTFCRAVSTRGKSYRRGNPPGRGLFKEALLQESTLIEKRPPFDNW